MSASTTESATGHVGFFYNVVFTSASGKIPRYAFCSVRMDQQIAYGSDLQSLREYLADGMGVPDLVVVSWRELSGAVREGVIKPRIQILGVPGV